MKYADWIPPSHTIHRINWSYPVIYLSKLSTINRMFDAIIRQTMLRQHIFENVHSRIYAEWQTFESRLFILFISSSSNGFIVAVVNAGIVFESCDLLRMRVRSVECYTTDEWYRIGKTPSRNAPLSHPPPFSHNLHAFNSCRSMTWRAVQ